MENNFLFWVIIAALFWFGLFVLPAYRMKSAILQVVRIFRKENSVCSMAAKNLDELGLARPPAWENLFRARDFKPHAIQFLIKKGIIRLSDDGKMCLEEKEADDFLKALRLEE